MLSIKGWIANRERARSTSGGGRRHPPAAAGAKATHVQLSAQLPRVGALTMFGYPRTAAAASCRVGSSHSRRAKPRKSQGSRPCSLKLMSRPFPRKEERHRRNLRRNGSAANLPAVASSQASLLFNKSRRRRETASGLGGGHSLEHHHRRCQPPPTPGGRTWISLTFVASQVPPVLQ